MKNLSILVAMSTVLTVCAADKVSEVQTVAPGVYFHQGDIEKSGHCNHGWIVFKDFVLVVDANFPSGATEILPKIKATTDKPVKFVFDTHHHGDHAYGNQIFADAGATVVAHSGVLAEMKKYETGAFGGKPGRWEFAAKGRADVKASKLHPPTLLFDTKKIFEDGKQRVELVHLGVAHTLGDGFAWLPKEKILFTGDACVNGPFNYTGDGDTGKWVKTLQAAKKLGPKIICPAHGPMGDATILDDQIAYFESLRAEVASLVKAGKNSDEVKAAAPQIRETLMKNKKIERYVGKFIETQVEKVFVEMGGKPFLPKTSKLNSADDHRIAHHRGLPHDHGTKLSFNLPGVPTSSLVR